MSKDLTGQRYGRLVATAKVCNDAYGSPMWLCECDCGERTMARSVDLLRGNTKSCGCLRRDMGIAIGRASVRDLTGQRYGRLVVLSRGHPEGDQDCRHAWWHCKCDCGGELLVRGYSLTSGMTRSCGCLRAETSRSNGRIRRRRSQREDNDA